MDALGFYLQAYLVLSADIILGIPRGPAGPLAYQRSNRTTLPWKVVGVNDPSPRVGAGAPAPPTNKIRVHTTMCTCMYGMHVKYV